MTDGGGRAEKWTALLAGRVDARQVIGGPVNALVPRREDAGFPEPDLSRRRRATC